MSFGWLGFVDPGGAGAVASVAVPVRAGPLEHSGRDRAVGPGSEGLEPVVVADTGLRGSNSSWDRVGVCPGSRRRGRARRRGRCRSHEPGGSTTGTHTCGRGESTCSRIRSGISYAGVDSSACRSMTGLMVTLVRESPHQPRTWSSRTRRWPSSIRPVGPNTVCSPTVEASKWTWRTTSRAAGQVGRDPHRRPARSRAVWVRARSPRALARRTSSDSVGPEGLLQLRRRGPGRGRGRGRRRGRGRPRRAGCRRSGRRPCRS